MRWLALFVLVVGLFLWALFREPQVDVANLLWGDNPAPWERVDGVFYPNRAVPMRVESAPGFRTVQDCRDWAERAARRAPSPTSSTFECQVGFIRSVGVLKEYRRTLH